MQSVWIVWPESVVANQYDFASQEELNAFLTGLLIGAERGDGFSQFDTLEDVQTVGFDVAKA